MPRWDVDVEFYSCGPSGNVFHVVSKVRYALKQLDKATESTSLKEFDSTFKLSDFENYEDVLESLNEWVNLVDLDGEYDYL